MAKQSEKLPPIGDVIRDAGDAKCCTFAELRDRAYAKADTGAYEDWRGAGAAVEFEHCPDAVQRLAADPILTRMLDARCIQARDRKN